MRAILGISAFYHDSAAALLGDGRILAAAQEERFTRRKHDPSFPAEAIRYCLAEGGVGLGDVEAVVFYDKPLLKFERLLETYLAFAPSGLRSFLAAMPVWLKEKLFLKQELRRELTGLADGGALPPLLFSEHHQSHAAAAFYASPFEEAAVLCLDGVGEWATSSIWHGRGAELVPLWQIDFPHSLGLLYSAFTYFCGFKVNSGEYKLMGLAPYGHPVYEQTIREHLIDIKDDGSFRLNMDCFDYATGLRMTGRRFADLFGGPARSPESDVTQREMDLAASVQVITEDVLLRLARSVRAETGARSLCLAGGVALNCVANGKLLRAGIFDDVWVQPAAGDAGGALGAALAVWHEFLDQPRTVNGADSMRGAYLGPAFSGDEIEQWLNAEGYAHERLGEDALVERLVELLEGGAVIGWFQGRMEFGPRALGGRSIIADSRNREMQSQLNLKIKYRESFRPFAPAVLEESVQDWFGLDRPSPYMLMVAEVREDRRLDTAGADADLFGIEKLKVSRSEIPAVTHVDYSARIQTVSERTNPRFHALIDAFGRRTGCPVLVNTSFNVRGEPIVGTPQDAYRCFMRTEMDYLVLEDCVLAKAAQPAWHEEEDWRDEFDLD